MMKILLFVIAFACLTAVLSIAEASDAVVVDTVVVIVNSANQQAISTADIKNIYSDVVNNWDNGNRVKLYNLPADDEARDKFSRAVFGLSTREVVQEENNRKITNNLKNPGKTKRASLIISLVTKNKNAIGYLPKNLLKENPSIRVVMEIK